MQVFDAVLLDLFGTLVTDRGGAIDGARELLEMLPERQWAIVTSCPRALAQTLIVQAQLRLPGVIVAAEDVQRGKPAPDCYRLAAHRLDAAPERCLVVEDSRQGIAAGLAAGMTVVAVARGRAFALGPADVRVIPALRNLELLVGEDGAIALR